MKQKNNYVFSLFIIGCLFFVFGFITCMNGVLIPFLKQACELNNVQAYLVTFAFYISYFVMSLPSSVLLKKVGFSKGMIIGLLVMAMGAALFIPAALNRSYQLFLCGIFLEGTGLTVLQAASNPYVTILGPLESAARRISIMGICNKVAGMIGLFFVGNLLLTDMQPLAEANKLDELAQRIVSPYIIISICLVALAIMLKLANLPEVNEEEETTTDQKQQRSLGSYTYLWLGVLAIFFYVGCEVISIDTLALYGKSQGIAEVSAKNFSIYSLIALTIGYIVGIVTMPKFISQQKALVVCCALALCLAVCAVVSHGMLSIGFIIALSFANSLMWPCIWALTIDHLGKYTKLGGAMLTMAIAGGAILPLIYGQFAGETETTHRLAYLILIPAYAYLLLFATIGHRLGKNKN